MAVLVGTLEPSHPNMRRVIEPRYLEIHEQELQHHPMRTYHPLQPALFSQSPPLVRHDGSLYETIPVDFGSYGICELKVYRGRPISQGTVPAIVWCSGAGMTPGDINGESSVMSRLCSEAQCIIINVTNRSVWEHPYKASTSDVFMMYNWVCQNQEDLGINGTICLGGVAAGASLGLSIFLERAELGLSLPAGLIMIAPAQLDHTVTAENLSQWNNMQPHTWAGLEDAIEFPQLFFPNVPYLSNWVQNPMRVPDEILEDVRLPPVFCLTMGSDLLSGVADLMCERMYNAGHTVREDIFKCLPHMSLGMTQVFPEVYEEMKKVFVKMFDVDMKLFAGLSWPPEEEDQHSYVRGRL